MEQEKDTTEDIINLIIARLKTIPNDARLSVGGLDEHNTQALTVENLITEVRNQSEIGKKIIETQLFYLRSLKDLPVGEYA